MIPERTGAAIALKAPKFLRDGVYGVISKNRKLLMGERPCGCGREDKDAYADRFIKDEFVVE